MNVNDLFIITVTTEKGIVILFEYFNRIHLPTRSTRQRMKIQKNFVASFVKIKKKKKKIRIIWSFL